MQSGVTGINAVRMYNPVKQSIDHDPEGKFIRRYVPELADVSAQWIHEPWRMPDPPSAYKSPLVDHDSAIKHARDEISKRRKTTDFRESARHVHQKLGSRAEKTSRNIPANKVKNQLSLDL